MKKLVNQNSTLIRPNHRTALQEDWRKTKALCGANQKEPVRTQPWVACHCWSEEPSPIRDTKRSLVKSDAWSMIECDDDWRSLRLDIAASDLLEPAPTVLAIHQNAEPREEAPSHQGNVTRNWNRHTAERAQIVTDDDGKAPLILATLERNRNPMHDSQLKWHQISYHVK